MKRLKSLSLSIGLLIWVTIFPFIFSNAFADTDGRERIVEDELNCLASNFQEDSRVDWADVCYTAVHDRQLAKTSREIDASPVYVVNQERALSVQKEKRESSSELSEISFDSDYPPLNKIEFGAESYDFTYKERIGVKDTGSFYGAFLSYTKRLGRNQPIRSLSDIFSQGDSINMFRLEVRGATGWVDYLGTGSWDDIRDIVGEIRGLAGYDIPLTTRTRVTPYAGLGYRYLFDDFSSVPAQTINGTNYLSGYDRESTYFYTPLGMEIENKFPKGWSLQATAEYDLLIQGWQRSHLEDSADSSGAAAGYDTLKNIQKKGFGLRASVRLTKETSRLDFFVEPYIRFWHIKDSNIQFETINGALLCDEDNLCRAGFEPDNKTRELGVKLGIRY